MSGKLIKKLADKKHRAETGLFLVEGEKSIEELLRSNFVVTELCGTKEFLNRQNTTIHAYERRMLMGISVVEMSEEDLGRVGTRETNNAGIAIVKQKQETTNADIVEVARREIVLALDDIRDPGNLGTIIRTADWFGVTNIIASHTTTDFYNPKVIASTMGSFTRVAVHYVDLATILEEIHREKIPVFGADMTGISPRELAPPTFGVLLMGSESHGISNTLHKYLSKKISIPRLGGAESLNVAVACGILLEAFRQK